MECQQGHRGAQRVARTIAAYTGILRHVLIHAMNCQASLGALRARCAAPQLGTASTRGHSVAVNVRDPGNAATQEKKRAEPAEEEKSQVGQDDRPGA